MKRSFSLTELQKAAAEVDLQVTSPLSSSDVDPLSRRGGCRKAGFLGFALQASRSRCTMSESATSGPSDMDAPSEQTLALTAVLHGGRDIISTPFPGTRKGKLINLGGSLDAMDC